MPAKQEKKNSGAGKFFLGAAIGAAIGAIASKFIDVSVTKDDGEPVEPKAPKEKPAKKPENKPVAKPAEKKTSE